MDKKRNKGCNRFPLWTIGLSFGVVMLIVGAFQGQLLDMYRKAVMICLECIGIG